MQKKADELERKIVRFTNIDNESFTHSFRGISITVAAGHSYMGRLPECDHLATHLARKMISRKKKAEIPAEKLGNLWTDKEVFEMKEKILSQVGTEDDNRINPEEARKRDIERLQKKFSPATVSEPKLVEVSKKEIIADLKSRGIMANVELSRDELMAQLMAAEVQGKEPLA